jgi:putative sigma-54 modulation protein
MNVSISGRHIDITDGIREHIDGGLGKVTEHFDKVIDIDVILDVQKHRHIAEINLHANGLRINAKEATGDLYSSIDSALVKIDRQVRKHKDRINRHQPRTAGEKREYQHKILEVSFDDMDHVDTITSDIPRRTINHEQVELKSLTVQEAAMQIDLMHENFLVFTNVETDQVNVIYKHDDGTFGHIEPTA